MFIRLVSLLLDLLAPCPLPDTAEDDLFRAPSTAQESNVEFNNLRPTPIEGELVWHNEPLVDENSVSPTIDGPTILFRVAQDTPPSITSYYRDEDGEMWPVRLDRSGLTDAMLEDLAAEFLRAKADAEAAPDALERDVISALRDSYGRELWRRAQRGAEHIHVGGRDYAIVPRDDGIVELVKSA